MNDPALGPRLIVALDFSEPAPIPGLLAQLDPQHCALKVGFELFVAQGPVLVAELMDQGFKVFLDLKFHDIPNTVVQACRAAARMGVWMLNVHASGGVVMMQAAVDAVRDVHPETRVLAVTVLTSSTVDTLAEIGVSVPPESQVLRLAELALEQAGLDGVVCSAQEAALLRARFGAKPWLVTPGIRWAEADRQDQQRITTPAQAIQMGASHLVMGRPITRAADPAAMVARALADVR